MNAVTRNKEFRFGRAITSDRGELSGILESTLEGLDTSIHVSKRACDEDTLMRQLAAGGIVTVPYWSLRIERAV